MKKLNIISQKKNKTSNTKTLRERKISIKNPSGRSPVEEGFDDMAAIAFGDNSKRIAPSDNATLEKTDGSTRSFYETVRQEDNEKRKNTRIISIVVIAAITIIVVVGMFINYQNEQIDGKIRVNYSANDFEGSNYEEVVSQLEKQGFTNITTIPVDDLVIGLVTKDGEVEKVEIDGYSTFSSSSRFLPDVEIVVTYHTFSSD